MTYLRKVEPVDNWADLMYYKYKAYVNNRAKDLTYHEKEDIYSSLWFYIRYASKSYKEGFNSSKRWWFFLYLKNYTLRLINKMFKVRSKEQLIDGQDEGYDLFFNMVDKDKPEYIVDQKILALKVEALINSIPQHYREIIKQYFGINCIKKSFRQMAREKGVTPAAVRNEFLIGMRYLKSRTINSEQFKNIGELLDYEA